MAGLAISQALYAGREVLKDVDDFLNIGQCPEGLTKIQKRRLVQKASKYTFVGEDLMVYGRDVLRKVLYKEEVGMGYNNVMRKVDIQVKTRYCFAF